jgi:hypothetical protein
LLLNSYRIEDAVEGVTDMADINLDFFHYKFSFQVEPTLDTKNTKTQGGKRQTKARN